MDDMPQISGAELTIMKVIWKHSPINTNEIADRLEQWSPKTIHTMLQRLVKKGAITYHKESRVFVYTPLIEEKEYIEKESKSFLNRMFDGELNALFITMLEGDKKLSGKEIDELMENLKKMKNQDAD